MTREEAIRIATNYYTGCMGEAPESMTLKSMEPAGGRITLRAAAFDEECDDEVIYEVELVPAADAISLKRVVRESSISGYRQAPKPLSALKTGDLFRMECDTVVYEFCKSEMRYGTLSYGFTRKGERTIYWQCRDIQIYPCDK
ncbi:MAG: hypothetical protein J6K02_12040 [Alistipes sp.]|jgi:hypothetical protein|uniref:hypothetical protein n=1 Tax=Alistipes sp. TaxID=1872444 RepID=UPI001B436303|nr:hypothetical protein [Alistipes sp.]MBP3529378.1 hypothetical protein [Alistipes sp.]